MLDTATAATTLAEAAGAAVRAAFSLEDRNEYGPIGERNGLFSAPIAIADAFGLGALAAHGPDGDLR